jgi:hypothetical protein
MRTRLLLFLTLVTISESACAFWKPIASVKAFDGKKEVIVWELKDLPDSVVSITLETSTGEETVLKDGSERVVQSAKIGWTKDSNVFVVRVFCAGEDLIFAYDTQARRSLDVKSVRESLQDEPGLIALINTPEEWEKPSR